MKTIYQHPALTIARIEQTPPKSYSLKPSIKVRLPDPRPKVAFEYHGKPRLVVPERVYKAKDGSLTLFAWEAESSHVKQFRIAEMVDYKRVA